MEKRKIWTKEMLKTLKEDCFDFGYKETAEHINKKHGTNLTPKQVKTGRKNYRIFSNVTGRFEKGRVPWNRGIRYIPGGRSAETRFKKGHVPVNKRPVGSESMVKHGYVRIKVEKPNTWKLKHRVVWEEHHGPLPEGHVVTFIDQDRENFDIKNLRLISKAQNAQLNIKNIRGGTKELFEASLMLLDINKAVRKKEKQRKG
jgi:hypothetical protein